MAPWHKPDKALPGNCQGVIYLHVKVPIRVGHPYPENR